MSGCGMSRRAFAGWLGAAFAGLGGAPAAAAAHAPRLLLASEAPAHIDPAGHLVSEKLDGVRALWDGERLRFRSGRPVAAPGWFLERLPRRALDGELWMRRGRFEALCGAVRRQEPRDADWRAISLRVFELPEAAGGFAARVQAMRRLVEAAGFAQLVAVEQQRIDGRPALRARLDAVVRAGGEGLMLHRADAPYVTGRSEVLLKLKPLHDAEATVIGHVEGKGRLRGRLGALRVRIRGGGEFLIGTGFSDAERADPPPAGSVVTFTHHGFTRQGVPRFASFLRRHDSF